MAQVSRNNDFALDNISFQAVCVQSDTVNISVDTSYIDAGANLAFCEKMNRKLLRLQRIFQILRLPGVPVKIRLQLLQQQPAIIM